MIVVSQIALSLDDEAFSRGGQVQQAGPLIQVIARMLAIPASAGNPTFILLLLPRCTLQQMSRKSRLCRLVV